MQTIKQVLMERDGMSEKEADELISEAKADLMRRLADGDMPDDICSEYFSLEPDYLFDLMDT